MQLIIDVDSAFVIEANEPALAFHGCAIERLRQMRLSDLLIAETDDCESPADDLLSGRRAHVRARQRDGRGHLCHVEVDAAPIDGPHCRHWLQASFRDISTCINAQSRLQVYSEFYEHLPIPLYRATRGATGRFIQFNPAFLRLFEADRPEQLFERDISDLYADPRERERFSNHLMRNGELRRYELQMRTLKGRVIQCIDTAFQHDDENSRVVFDGVLEDVTRQRELERELAYQAHYDDLTELANRRYCDNLLDSEIERCERYAQPLSLLMLDLDHFKRVNDEWGHAAGDDLLRRVAECIRDHARQTDIPGRWGGEEFIVLLPSTDERAAVRIANRLCRSISTVASEDGHGATASIGCGRYRSGEGRDAFLRRLDEALYAAKDAGRDRVCLASASEDADQTARSGTREH